MDHVLNLMSMSTAGILLFHMLVSISTLCNQRKMYLLRSDVKSGRRNEAWISYNSSTHNLSVAFTDFRNNSVVMQGLDYQVDLRQHLPEFVTFGFSMETGVDFAIFSIYSWEFNSSLEMDDETTNPVSNPKRRRKNITALVVGLSLGGGFLVGGVVLIIWLAGIGRKRKEGDEEDNQGFSEYIDDEFERGAGPKRFPYKELALATNDFNDDQKLGQGDFGGVDKGFLRETNSEIAVKRLKHGKAVVLRKGLFRDIRNPTSPYGGEATGSNPGISKSTRFKN